MNKKQHQNNWPVLLLPVFTSCFLFLWAAGDRGLWSAEGRWVEINQEMFLSAE